MDETETTTTNTSLDAKPAPTTKKTATKKKAKKTKAPAPKEERRRPLHLSADHGAALCGAYAGEQDRTNLPDKVTCAKCAAAVRKELAKSPEQRARESKRAAVQALLDTWGDDFDRTFLEQMLVGQLRGSQKHSVQRGGSWSTKPIEIGNGEYEVTPQDAEELGRIIGQIGQAKRNLDRFARRVLAEIEAAEDAEKKAGGR